MIATQQLRPMSIGDLFDATFISQIGLIISYPLLFSVYTLLYYDLRIRKEGYDLEVLAQQAAQT